MKHLIVLLVMFGTFTTAVHADNENVITSKKYVDDEMAKLQPQFSGLGNDKLMLYSDTTNGEVTSRDIVTTLGTSTTADSIPTRGAIVAGLNTKQDILNGPSGYVVANTGISGVVTPKPIYSTTDNYATALVTASDLNQIVTTAVNSELTKLPGIGWQINTSVILPTLHIYLDANIDGTSVCLRNLSGSYSTNGMCDATTLSTLGASNNKSGLWGTVMPYGDIVGKSVCGATSGTANTAATDTQENSLTTEFNNQTGSGTLSSLQIKCWCKMEAVAGEPLTSSWVFLYTNNDSALCASSCAYNCAYAIMTIVGFRRTVFNALQ